MKYLIKFFVFTLFFSILLLSCVKKQDIGKEVVNPQFEKTQKFLDSIENEDGPIITPINEWVVDGIIYKVMIIDSCEYLYDSNFATPTKLTHKGNCNNKIHYGKN